MNANRNQKVSRRRFIKTSVRGAGVLGAAVACFSRSSGRAGENTNPFAYDISHFEKTDPKLIQYEQAARWPCPHEGGRRLAVGPRNTLYVASGNYVSIVDERGTVELETALSGAPRALAVAEDGSVFVSLRDHIEVFDGKGQRKAAWEAPGKKSWLAGIAVGSKDVFCADAGHRVVWRYDRSGRLVGKFGERNLAKETPGFIVPSPFFDIEIHPDGLLRVVNPGRHRIEAYTLEGEFELAWGKASAAIEGFCGCCNPVGMALMRGGRFVTCEKGLPRVKIYAEDGAFECVVAGTESFPENAKVGAGAGEGDGVKAALDVAVDSTGRVFILDTIANDIRIMVPKAGTRS